MKKTSLILLCILLAPTQHAFSMQKTLTRNPITHAWQTASGNQRIAAVAVFSAAAIWLTVKFWPNRQSTRPGVPPAPQAPASPATPSAGTTPTPPPALASSAATSSSSSSSGSMPSSSSSAGFRWTRASGSHNSASAYRSKLIASIVDDSLYALHILR